MSHDRANVDWNISEPNGNTTWDRVPIAVLMDIRRELQTINQLLGCRNFIRIPSILDQIKKNTKKPSRKRVPK